MQRPSLWLMLVVLLLGVLFLREPRLQQSENMFLRWLLRNCRLSGPTAPLTVVEMGGEQLAAPDAAAPPPRARQHVGASAVSPLEFALFLQAAMELKPGVIAFENILKWRERDRTQEQVFIDQAMRVPRLLLGAELTETSDPDNAAPEIAGFSDVTGKRGDLPEFSGIGRQPAEDVRLISTAGFVNLPDDVADDLHVPLLFRYRGQVIPSFALEAVLLWLRVSPIEVKIRLGSDITLPEGRRIPIASDGTLMIAPGAATKINRMTMNELLVTAQEGEKTEPTAQMRSLRDQVVLVRTPANPLSPPDIFAAAIGMMQTNRFVHRVSMLFDCVVIILAAAAVTTMQKISRVDLALIAIAFTAAYCLIALTLISRWLIWIPGVLPLGMVWLLVIAAPLLPRFHAARPPSATTVPPPIV